MADSPDRSTSQAFSGPLPLTAGAEALAATVRMSYSPSIADLNAFLWLWTKRAIEFPDVPLEGLVEEFERNVADPRDLRIPLHSFIIGPEHDRIFDDAFRARFEFAENRRLYGQLDDLKMREIKIRQALQAHASDSIRSRLLDEHRASPSTPSPDALREQLLECEELIERLTAAAQDAKESFEAVMISGAYRPWGEDAEEDTSAPVNDTEPRPRPSSAVSPSGIERQGSATHKPRKQTLSASSQAAIEADVALPSAVDDEGLDDGEGSESGGEEGSSVGSEAGEGGSSEDSDAVAAVPERRVQSPTFSHNEPSPVRKGRVERSAGGRTPTAPPSKDTTTGTPAVHSKVKSVILEVPATLPPGISRHRQYVGWNVFPKNLKETQAVAWKEMINAPDYRLPGEGLYLRWEDALTCDHCHGGTRRTPFGKPADKPLVRFNGKGFSFRKHVELDLDDWEEVFALVEQGTHALRRGRWIVIDADDLTTALRNYWPSKPAETEFPSDIIDSLRLRVGAARMKALPTLITPASTDEPFPNLYIPTRKRASVPGKDGRKRKAVVPTLAAAVPVVERDPDLIPTTSQSRKKARTHARSASGGNDRGDVPASAPTAPESADIKVSPEPGTSKLMLLSERDIKIAEIRRIEIMLMESHRVKPSELPPINLPSMDSPAAAMTHVAVTNVATSTGGGKGKAREAPSVKSGRARK
ncbi:hypothetical protein FKP32DRAFT_1677741 [Trametes sanguinea]|nr:hypothetical protein FKP32DRAFT_1677741 [Trametes sanguinea]